MLRMFIISNLFQVVNQIPPLVLIGIILFIAIVIISTLNRIIKNALIRNEIAVVVVTIALTTLLCFPLAIYQIWYVASYRSRLK